MSTVELAGYDVEFGLFLVENDPSLTFLLFIAFVLIAVLGLRFGYYAYKNRTRSGITVQSTIWRYLQYIGLFAALYGCVGVLEITTSLSIQARDGLLLIVTLLLALALRQVYFAANAGNTTSSLYPYERWIQLIFVGGLLVYLGGVTVWGQNPATATLLGSSALAYATYGMSYFYDQTERARLRGTMLDSLLRHLLPILTFASLVSILALAIPFGLERIVVLHVQVVFIIMTATTFMTATVKLRQNLAGL